MRSAGLKPGTVAVCIAVAVLVIAFFFFNSSPPKSSVSSSQPVSVSNEQYLKVAAIMAKQGVRSERVENSADVFRFYMPERAAQTVGYEDARRLATVTRSRLGTGAAVYILSPSGSPLADATPWNP